MPVIMFSHCSQGRGYNTGVTLMNLAAMKRRKWAKLWRSVAKTYLPKAGPTKLADQVCEGDCFISEEYDVGRTDHILIYSRYIYNLQKCRFISLLNMFSMLRSLKNGRDMVNNPNILSCWSMAY